MTRHDGGVTTLADAPTLVVGPRSPDDWVEDMHWHRRMFNQSMFRWAPEDAMHIAMRWTRGRVLFETPAHLRKLDAQLFALREYTGQIQDAMAAPLREAQQRGTAKAPVGQGLELIGLTRQDARFIIDTAYPVNPERPHRQVQRALRGIPLSNPYSQVWELRQMHSMYLGAVNLLEDTICDLALELAPSQGWEHLASLTVNRYGQQLRWRVEEQREQRGEPGDPRRQPAQTY